MTNLFGKFLATAAIGCALAVGAADARAADFKLIISSWAPPGHGMNAIMWPKLIQMIEKATDGKVTAEIRYKLASPPAQFDLVQDGAADFAWIFHGYNPGRFTATKLIELPGYKGNAQAASVAHWRAHAKFLAKNKEHRGVKLIALMTHGPGQIHSNKAIKSLADIKGLKLRLPGGVASDAGAALGATGIKVPAPKVYETLASKAADGVAMPMETRKGFKLIEVAKNVFEMPGGFYRGSFALIMNEAKFKSLPAKYQAALNKIFGEPLSRMAGGVWDQTDAIGRKATMSTKDNKITVASPADQKAYAKIGAQIKAKVIKQVTAKGIDAKAAIAYIASQMAAQAK
jgi:TRAP-type C4-dicarboxylate transport system substrate-binding protein